MSRIIQAPIKSLSGATANGVGSFVDVRDYKNVTITVYTSGSTNATIKFAVSNALKVPTFSSAPSTTNVYDYVQISPVNSQLTANLLSGSTGIVLTGTDIVKLYEVNSFNDAVSFRWLCPIISGYTTGTITVEITGSADVNR